MKYLAFLFLIYPAISLAKFNIQPGLWTFTSEVKVNGKKFDIHNQVAKALENIPEAQRAQMMEMMKGMGNSNVQFGTNFQPEICITDEMIKNGNLNPENSDDCTNTISKNTDKVILGSFKCKDGTAGSFTINILTDSKYSGKVFAKSGSGDTTEIDYVSTKKSPTCK